MRKTMEIGQSGTICCKSTGRERMAATVLGMIVIFAAMGNNWTDFGLPPFVTGNRLAYLLMVASLLVFAALRVKHVQLMHRVPGLLVLALVFVAMWGTVSAALSNNTPSVSVTSVVTWLVMAMVTLGVSILAKQAMPRALFRLINICVVGSFVVIALTFFRVAMFVSMGDFITLNWFALRRGFDTAISVGLNRHLNGLFVLSVIPISVSLGVIRRSGWIQLVSLLVSVSFPLLCLVLGSRQNLLAYALFVVTLLMIANQVGFGRLNRKVIRRRAILLGLLTLLTFLQIPGSSDWVYRRFIQDTETQLVEGIGRQIIYNAALGTIAASPITGIGPGAFYHRHGFYPHNGYLGLGAELGLPPLFFLLGGIAFAFVWSFQRRPRRNEYEQFSFFATTFSCALVVTLWLTNWNDLLNEAMFWVVMSLLVGGVGHSSPRLGKRPQQELGSTARDDRLMG